MKLLVSSLICAVTLSLSAVTAKAADALSLEDIQAMDQDQLDALYEYAPAGTIPDGASNGRAIFFPGSILNAPTTALASLLWQGKVFDNANGVLLNRVFGFEAIKAKVFKADSLFDGNEAIIVDYQDTSVLCGPVRDEIRQIGDHLYLGRAYIRTLFGPIFAVNFALDFADAE
ncbi:MAG: hypothetical protein WCO71_08955 [Pseudomonadota bacterium]